MLSLLIISSTLQPSLANFPCETRKSVLSGDGDDDTISIGCTISYPTLVSCGCSTYYSDESNSDGCFIVNDKCYAQNGNDGNGVYAHARCCKFPETDVQCTSIAMDEPSTGAPKAYSCEQYQHQYLLGCTVKSSWTGFDGCYPGTDNPFSISISPTMDYTPATINYCTAVHGGSRDWTRGYLTCCDSSTYALNLTCVLRYGAESTLSTAVCGSGYTMTGCSGYGPWTSVNQWYITSNGLNCKARSHNSDHVHAIAICCKIETDAPTLEPTISLSVVILGFLFIFIVILAVIFYFYSKKKNVNKKRAGEGMHSNEIVMVEKENDLERVEGVDDDDDILKSVNETPKDNEIVNAVNQTVLL